MDSLGTAQGPAKAFPLVLVCELVTLATGEQSTTVQDRHSALAGRRKLTIPELPPASMLPCIDNVVSWRHNPSPLKEAL